MGLFSWFFSAGDELPRGRHNSRRRPPLNPLAKYSSSLDLHITPIAHVQHVQVETLEERLLLSTFTVTVSMDNVLKKGTLSYELNLAKAGDTVVFGVDVEVSKAGPVAVGNNDDGVTIDGNGHSLSADINGGNLLLVRALTTVTIENLTFSYSLSGAQGPQNGAVTCQAKSSTTFVNDTFTNDNSAYTLALNNCTTVINGCSESVNGGDDLWNGGQVTADNLTVTGQQVDIKSGLDNISNSAFTNGSEAKPPVVVEGGQITFNNTAIAAQSINPEDSLYIRGGKVILNDCNVNGAPNGYGIVTYNGFAAFSLTVNGGTINNNGDGAINEEGFNSAGAQVTINDTTISGNGRNGKFDSTIQDNNGVTRLNWVTLSNNFSPAGDIFVAGQGANQHTQLNLTNTVLTGNNGPGVVVQDNGNAVQVQINTSEIYGEAGPDLELTSPGSSVGTLVIVRASDLLGGASAPAINNGFASAGNVIANSSIFGDGGGGILTGTSLTSRGFNVVQAGGPIAPMGFNGPHDLSAADLGLVLETFASGQVGYIPTSSSIAATNGNPANAGKFTGLDGVLDVLGGPSGATGGVVASGSAMTARTTSGLSLVPASVLFATQASLGDATPTIVLPFEATSSVLLPSASHALPVQALFSRTWSF